MSTSECPIKCASPIGQPSQPLHTRRTEWLHSLRESIGTWHCVPTASRYTVSGGFQLLRDLAVYQDALQALHGTPCPAQCPQYSGEAGARGGRGSPRANDGRARLPWLRLAVFVCSTLAVAGVSERIDGLRARANLLIVPPDNVRNLMFQEPLCSQV